MAKNRSFIFASSFSQEVKAELIGITTNFADKISNHVYTTMMLLANKDEIRGALFSKKTEGSADIMRRVSNTLNAYVLGSEFVSSIQIVDKDTNIVVTSGRTETGLRKFKSDLWKKLNDSTETELKHIMDENFYIFSIKINNEARLILFVDVTKFKAMVPSSKTWFRGLNYSDDCIFFGSSNSAVKESVVRTLKKSSVNINEPVEFSISSNIAWGKKLSIVMRDGRKIPVDINVFVVGNPKAFPLNMLQRLLLLINAVIILALVLLLLLKLKNDADRAKIAKYKEKAAFINDVLEESSEVLDESSRGTEIALDELDRASLDFETTGVTGSSELIMDTPFSLEEKESSVSKDEILKIPDEAYEKEPEGKIDKELQDLADVVSKGIEIKNPELQGYWENVSNILGMDFSVNRYALLEKDEDGLFSVVKSEGFSPQTIENLKFTEFDKFYNKFFKLKKNLYIIKDAFAVKALSEMFAPEDKKYIGELL